MAQFGHADPQTNYACSTVSMRCSANVAIAASCSGSRSRPEMTLRTETTRDTLRWFKSLPPGRQTHMKAACRRNAKPKSSQFGTHSRRSNCLVGCDGMGAAAVFLIPYLPR